MEEEATASGGGVMAWTVRGNVPSLGKPSSWAGDSGFRLEVWVLVAWPVDGMRQYFRTNANRLAEGGPNTPRVAKASMRVNAARILFMSISSPK